VKRSLQADGPASAAPVLEAEGLAFAYPDADAPLWAPRDIVLHPGLTLVLGGDGRGKSTLLRLLAGRLAPSTGRLRRAPAEVYLEDMADPQLDALPVQTWLAAQASRYPDWNEAVAARLVEAYALQPHIDKAMFMLSTGGRRKAGLVAAAACGAPLTLLDLPYAALDAPSRRVLSECLVEAAGDPQRAWVVADHGAPVGLPVVPVIDLGD
jgi:ABC-type multidrug transport system ATPase subunit